MVQGLLVLAGGAVVVGFVVAGPGAGVPAGARLTLVVFVAAVALWVATRIDETLVALAAALVLVVAGGCSTGIGCSRRWAIRRSGCSSRRSYSRPGQRDRVPCQNAT
ncbi:MAG: hypothetical protein ACRDRR_01685 [Pseudonocardiaceae bacterium]